MVISNIKRRYMSVELMFLLGCDFGFDPLIYCSVLYLPPLEPFSLVSGQRLPPSLKFRSTCDEPTMNIFN